MNLKERKTKKYRWFEQLLPEIKVPVMNDISIVVSDGGANTPEKHEIDYYEPTGRTEYNRTKDIKRYEYKYVGTRIE